VSAIEVRLDYILILPWNLKTLAVELYTAEWGCKLIVPIPEVHVINLREITQ
jgi:hypothetical protein